MALTMAVVLLRLLLFCCGSLVCLVAQQTTGCGSLGTQYTLNNLRNLSVGISDVQQFYDLALSPFIAQPRVSGTNGSDLARTHIKTWMSAAGWSVEEDSVLYYVPFPYTRRFTNVIATLNPGRSRRVVLACHYDSKWMPGVRFVGAIDSAVPCAVLMDSALRLKDVFLSKKNTYSDLTVQFIFFDGEEAFVQWSEQDSLYGARHLAQMWERTPDPNSPGRNRLQTIETLILLDLIGTADTHFKKRFTETAPVYDKLQDIETCLRNEGLLKPNQFQLPLFTSQRDFNMVEDDHIPFLKRGVPIVHLITVPFPAVWHTPYDDVTALDFDRTENLARILRVFLADLPL